MTPEPVTRRALSPLYSASSPRGLGRTILQAVRKETHSGVNPHRMSGNMDVAARDFLTSQSAPTNPSAPINPSAPTTQEPVETLFNCFKAIVSQMQQNNGAQSQRSGTDFSRSKSKAGLMLEREIKSQSKEHRRAYLVSIQI